MTGHHGGLPGGVPDRPLRFGTLGAARITPVALIGPARAVEGVQVVAVAARDEARARAFARAHGIPRVHRRYEDLLADPNVDAVYVPLPNSLHAEWSIRALEAGKHVLCEKPMATTGEEAAEMAETARRTGRVLVEAFHWRYHGIAGRMSEIVASGALGRVRRIEATYRSFQLNPGPLRSRVDLGGGATMDLGCYGVSVIRFLAGAEPTVASARAGLMATGVDRWMRADLEFADGRSASLTCALYSAALPKYEVRVIGDAGEMVVTNPLAPHLFNRLRMRTRDVNVAERVSGEPTYTAQLRAFAQAIREGTSLPTDAADAVGNMRVIDEIYRAAGMRRGLRPEA